MRNISEKDLIKILKSHQKWLINNHKGARADLRETDLRGADLHGVNLDGAILDGANLDGANLRGTNLRGANLRGADLHGADLDYSCLPLWCGSLSAEFDDQQIIQIAYHMVCAGIQSPNTSEETKRELEKLIPFANKFHRVEECGMITKTEAESE